MMGPRIVFAGSLVGLLLLAGVGCAPAGRSAGDVTETVDARSGGEARGTAGEARGSSDEQRPLIWVRPGERTDILAKIAANAAVADYYADFTARVEDDLAAWARDPAVYFRQLPLRWADAEAGMIPPFRTYTDFSDGPNRTEQNRMSHLLQTAIDCGVLYFLTEEERYARYAGGVLHTFVHAIRPLPLAAGDFNAGRVYPEDHLREAREIGAQLPILYDFVQPWLARGGRVYDVGKEEEVAFDVAAAEAVFRDYAELVIHRGGTGTNWPILEASSLVGNALALSDSAERARYLNYFLEESTPRQDALPKIGAFYAAHGGSWPESFGYSQHVGEFLTYLFAVLSHHDPSSRLVGAYPQVVAALPEAYYFTYPGGTETILHGDGHRAYHPMLEGYEMAYHLGRRERRAELVEVFGPLINHAVAGGEYARFRLPPERNYGAAMYWEPIKLLWFAAEVPGAAGDYPLAVTAELPFAGITVQRNLSPSGRAEDGLMGFVGGGAYVHGHATGMSMELFGRGFVLGSKGGRTRYRTEIHENYYRLFASNNTVIVNGATRSDGGWVRLGTDRVRRLAAEPEPGVAPVAPDFSFTVSAFRDTVGKGAEAYQERTLGIVRTTDSTGYYVDVFRSHSELPEQYHDYIYRNVGETLSLRDAAGRTLPTEPTPARYRANAGATWRQNRSYRQPGWHYFGDVRTSAPAPGDITATFVADRLGPEPIAMRAHLPGQPNRTYTTATSPPLTQGPRGYRNQRAPTLVVRQEGSAWDTPFAVVYEPVAGSRHAVASVTSIGRGRRCEGLVVKSNERAGGVTQIVLLPTDPDRPVDYPDYGIRFLGRYAVVTLGPDGELRSVYLGDGRALTVADYRVRPATEGRAISAFLDFAGSRPAVTTTTPLYLTDAAGTEVLIPPD